MGVQFLPFFITSSRWLVAVNYHITDYLVNGSIYILFIEELQVWVNVFVDFGRRSATLLFISYIIGEVEQEGPWG